MLSASIPTRSSRGRRSGFPLLARPPAEDLAGVLETKSATASLAFDRARILRSSREFAEVKARGSAFRAKHCLLAVLPKPCEKTRVGFITSKKSVGGAVQRNRAKRRLREIVRLRWPRLPETGYWIVIIAFRSALTAPHQELANDLEHALAAAGALEPIECVEVPAPPVESRR